MRRREFIALLGGAAAWPLTARAQQPAMPVVGFLSSAQPAVFAHLIAAFRQGLSQTDYVEGQNVAFEYRPAGNEYDRFPILARELVERRVAIIFSTGGTAAALAAKRVTASTPILFYMGGDPVRLDIVASLNRPGGNITGFSWLGPTLGAKRLGIVRELVPNSTAIAMLVNPRNPDSESEIADVQYAAQVLGLGITILTASSEPDLDRVFPILENQRTSALLVASDPYFSIERIRIAALAERHRIPAIYERREFPDAGGLMSYGHHRVDAYHQLGIYAGRILKGNKPAELPVLQPTKFELVVNLKAAKNLAFEIPPMLLARADGVIE